MELRHLRYYVAALREGSMTRAAKVLNMAQPPLSRQIQQLEEELGVSLLERGRRPLRTTEAGRFFFEHALTILDRAEALKTMTRRVGQIGKRRLGIGVVGSILHGPLPEILRHFRSTYPEVDIEMIELSSDSQAEALKEGRIDVGFCRLNIESSAVRREILVDEPFVAALPIGHPLLDLGGTLALKDLAGWPLIVYPVKPSSLATHVPAQLREQNFDASRVYEVSELQTALGLVAAAEGICLIPAAVQRMRRDDVIYRPLRDGQITSPIIMCSRADDDTRETATLLQLVRDAYRASEHNGEAAAGGPNAENEMVDRDENENAASMARC